MSVAQECSGRISPGFRNFLQIVGRSITNSANQWGMTEGKGHFISHPLALKIQI